MEDPRETQKEGTCHIRLTERKENVSPQTIPRKRGTEYVVQVSGIRVKVIKGKFMFFSGLGVEDDVWAGSLHPCHSSQVG